jgi:glycerate kinase
MLGLDRFRSALQTAQLFTLPAGAPFTGAAGGIALGLGALNSKVQCQSGAQTYIRLAAVRAAMNDADLVVCGEGRIDETTLYGKSPYAVAMLAKELHVPTVGVFGEHAEPVLVQALGLRQAYSITETAAAPSIQLGEQSRRDWIKTRRNRLVAIGRMIGSYARGIDRSEDVSA